MREVKKEITRGHIQEKWSMMFWGDLRVHSRNSYEYTTYYSNTMALAIVLYIEMKPIILW